MGGQNIGRAIEGANQNQDARLQAAAGIEQGNASQYNQIGQQAGSAAAGSGNPFSLFSNALSGTGGLGSLGGLFGGHSGASGPTNFMSSGGIDPNAGIQTPNTGSTITPLNPANIGKGFGG
jgi:hypothetical protein